MLHRSTSNLPLSHRSTSPSSCSSLSAPLFLPDPPATTLSLCFQTTATTNLAFDQKSTIWGDFAQVHSDYLLKQLSSAFVFSGFPVTFTLVLKYNLIWSILVFECASNHCQKDNAHIETPELYICTQINETPITSMSLSPTCVRIERIFVKVSFEAVFRAGSYSTNWQRGERIHFSEEEEEEKATTKSSFSKRGGDPLLGPRHHVDGQDEKSTAGEMRWWQQCLSDQLDGIALPSKNDLEWS